NPNVTLELGLAFGMSERAFIVFDPSKLDAKDVPSDLRGFDRLQYDSYSKLEEEIGRLVAQELPVTPTHDVQNQLESLRKQAVSLIVESDSGLRIGDIATALGISIDLAKLVIKPMVGKEIMMTGATRGARYFDNIAG